MKNYIFKFNDTEELSPIARTEEQAILAAKNLSGYRSTVTLIEADTKIEIAAFRSGERIK